MEKGLPFKQEVSEGLASPRKEHTPHLASYPRVRSKGRRDPMSETTLTIKLLEGSRDENLTGLESGKDLFNMALEKTA